MNDRRPERLDELLAGYVLGDLSPEEAEDLRQQLEADPHLAAEVQQLQQVLAALPYALPETAPPDRLRDTLLNSVAEPVVAEPVVAEPVAIAPRRKRRQTLIGWGIAAGVAALSVGAIGLDNARLRQQVTGLQAQVGKQQDVIAMLQQPKTRLVSLKGMDRAADASGSIVVTPGEPKAVLVLQNLPALPQGQYYQLWAVVAGQKIPWERFSSNDRGNVFTKLLLPANQITTLVVTVEAATDPRNPSGPMVMTSDS